MRARAPLILVALATAILLGVEVTAVPPIDGTWSHGEPGHWTFLGLTKEERLGPGPRQVAGDLHGALKETLTGDSSATLIHMAGSWSNPHLELELGGHYYLAQDDPCFLAGEVVGGGSRSLLTHWLVHRRQWGPYRFRAVLQCPEWEPFPIVFERWEDRSDRRPPSL